MAYVDRNILDPTPGYPLGSTPHPMIGMQGSAYEALSACKQFHKNPYPARAILREHGPEMYARWLAGEMLAALGREFDVHPSAIGALVRRYR